MPQHSWMPFASLALIGLSSACAGFENTRAGEVRGEVTFALHSNVGNVTYELRDAVFEISGASTIELKSQDAPDADLLEQTLPVGQYQAELAPGWHLFEIDPQQSREVAATLVTENPAKFTISAGAATEIRFQFRVPGQQATPAQGTLQVAIDVAAGPTRSILFTELMVNPKQLADSAGEWFELQNTGQDAIDLNGCVVERDNTAFTINRSLKVAPGQAVTFSHGQSPGFTPDYVYSEFTLPNSAAFVLNLRCDERLLDTISVDPQAWPGGPGVAASLSATAVTPADNDSPAVWCAATTPYNSDLGTPGKANPVCNGGSAR